MKILGFALLVSGWAIALTAVGLLVRSAPRTIFVIAGIGVEILGMALVIRAHPVRRGQPE